MKNPMQYNPTQVFLRDKITLTINSINTNEFTNNNDLIYSYSLFWNDYLDFIEQYPFSDLLDFLKDSVKNNHMLSDTLNPCEFTVKKQKIRCRVKEDNFTSSIAGEVLLNQYKLFFWSSFVYIEDTTSKKQYIYYGD